LIVCCSFDPVCTVRGGCLGCQPVLTSEGTIGWVPVSDSAACGVLGPCEEDVGCFQECVQHGPSQPTSNGSGSLALLVNCLRCATSSVQRSAQMTPQRMAQAKWRHVHKTSHETSHATSHNTSHAAFHNTSHETSHATSQHIPWTSHNTPMHHPMQHPMTPSNATSDHVPTLNLLDPPLPRPTHCR
jgi:hypothetical protein